MTRRNTFRVGRLPGFGVWTALVFVYLYAPLVILVLFSFNANRTVTVWRGFTLDWYAQAFADDDIRRAALTSLGVAGVATVVSTVLATLAALALVRGGPFRGKGAATALLLTPLMVPEIVTAVATLAFFALLGVSLGVGKVVLAHCVFCVPFALLPIQARLRSMDDTLEQAARDLYAGPWRTFCRVTLPLLLPGIVSGALLAFIVSMDDFIITLMVAEAGTTTLPLYIYGLVRVGVTPEVNAVSSLMLALSVLFVALSLLVERRGRVQAGKQRAMSHEQRVKARPSLLMAALTHRSIFWRSRMKLILSVLALLASSALAQGELRIYNWSGYTSEEMVKAFEEETGIDVSVDTYDTNETLLAKLKAGNTGYDIVVPTHNFVSIFVQEGLLEPINAAELENFDNIDERWRDPEWDPGNVYTVPWQWGTTSFSVDTALFEGDVNTFEVLFNPPEAYRGNIGMFDSWDEVLPMALRYLGYDEPCTTDTDAFRAALELLEAQKPFVKVYTSEGILENMIAGETSLNTYWNGASMRVRAERGTVVYAYPKEGVSGWMDNLAVAAGAPNKDNALTFIDWFLEPEHAAMQSNFARYGNGVAGSAEFMDAELQNAPEIVPPEGANIVFQPTCSPEYTDLASRVWTRLKQ